MTTAATKSYQYRATDALPLYALKRRKAQKQRGFRAKTTYEHCIKDKVLIDPACGSGNFLTETYLSLRRLENKVIADLIALNKGKYGTQTEGQVRFGDTKGNNPIKVSMSQFYGIEINDFAVTVAKTALWIAESQTMQETEQVIHMNLDFLPLKTNASIHEGNALRMHWNDIISKEELNYIMGNPPFSGGMMMNRAQKADIVAVLGNVKGVGELDYVSGWYKKAADFIKNTSIRCSFVSTNSICQGQQATTLWKPLYHEGNIRIDFAYQTFIWDSEVKEKAKVHCIIIGFSNNKSKGIQKKIFDSSGVPKKVENINQYLCDAPIIFITSRTKPLCNVPPIHFGSMPRDGGGFSLTEEERNKFILEEPVSSKWIHPYVGAYEFINNKSRWCLWLKGANPCELRQCPLVMKRIEFVKKFRKNSIAAGTYEDVSTAGR